MKNNDILERRKLEAKRAILAEFITFFMASMILYDIFFLTLSSLVEYNVWMSFYIFTNTLLAREFLIGTLAVRNKALKGKYDDK